MKRLTRRQLRKKLREDINNSKRLRDALEKPLIDFLEKGKRNG